MYVWESSDMQLWQEPPPCDSSLKMSWKDFFMDFGDIRLTETQKTSCKMTQWNTHLVKYPLNEVIHRSSVISVSVRIILTQSHTFKRGLFKIRFEMIGHEAFFSGKPFLVRGCRDERVGVGATERSFCSNWALSHSGQSSWPKPFLPCLHTCVTECVYCCVCMWLDSWMRVCTRVCVCCS